MYFHLLYLYFILSYFRMPPEIKEYRVLLS